MVRKRVFLYKKCISPPGGLEPPTFRLTAERASRLRHGGSLEMNRVFSYTVDAVKQIAQALAGCQKLLFLLPCNSTPIIRSLPFYNWHKTKNSTSHQMQAAAYLSLELNLFVSRQNFAAQNSARGKIGPPPRKIYFLLDGVY